MSDTIAGEVRTICRQAAEPVRAGEGVKAQLLRAWEALGRPPYWRLRSGWYGEGGGWSAAAVADFQRRYLDMMARRARQAAGARAIEAARRGETLSEAEQAREAYRTLVERIEAIEAALRLPGPDAPGA